MSPLIFAAAALLQAAPEHAPVQQAAPAAVEEGDNPATVAAGRDQDQRMTVPVTIDGQGPFHFMIDTGSQATVVTTALSERLGLAPFGHATLVGTASRRVVPLVHVDGLEFAKRKFDGIEAPLLERRHVGADGILGLDSLQNLRVLIDFRADTIAVNDAKALGGNRGFEIIVRARRKLGRLIITSARVDGVQTAVIVDTGAQGNVANLTLQRRLRARQEHEVRATDVNGVQLIGKLDFIETLRIDGITINNLPTAFAASPVFAALGLEDKPALILGMRDLAMFDRIAIDFSSRSLLFDLPKDAGRPAWGLQRL